MPRTILAAVVGLVLLSIPTIMVATWVSGAKARLAQSESAPVDASQRVAVAAAADEGYCNGDLRRVLRRVLQSCGLLGSGAGVRGCQPVEARNVATMSGDDFNALFNPLAQRAGIIEFERDGSTLDQSDRDLIRGLRRLEVESGAAKGARICRGCGQPYVPPAVMGYISGRLKDEPKEFLELCPSCRRKLYTSRNT